MVLKTHLRLQSPHICAEHNPASSSASDSRGVETTLPLLCCVAVEWSGVVWCGVGEEGEREGEGRWRTHERRGHHT